MVALRQRSSRPSYNIAANLALSDDEASNSDQSVNAEAGPSAPRQSSHKRKKARVPTPDSSGAESAFVPNEEEDEGDVDMEEEQTVEGVDLSADEDMVGPDLEEEASDEDLVSVHAYSRMAGDAVDSKPRQGAQLVQSRIDFKATPLEYAKMDPKYQRMLWNDARYDPRKGDSGSKFTKPFLSSKDWFPHGPLVPLGRTRLRSAPDGRSESDLVPDCKDLDSTHRQKVLQRLGKFVPAEIPWDAWEGEMWRPEKPHQSEARRRHGAVDTGYRDIGRYNFDKVTTISQEDAYEYLPTPRHNNIHPYIECLLGPTEEQRTYRFELFTWRHIEDTNSTKEGFIFNAGGPIWGLDWCPMPEKELGKRGWSHYVAVSPHPSVHTPTSIGEKWPADTPGCIQIWSMLPRTQKRTSNGDNSDMEVDPDTSGDDDKGHMCCEMVLCIEGGAATDLKWLPLGAWDEYEVDPQRGSIPKIGIVAATLLDGSVSFFAVPEPSAMRKFADVSDSTTPLFVKAVPLLKAELDDTVLTGVDFASGSRLAVGCTNGHVAVYDVRQALQRKQPTVLPSVYLGVTQASLRAVTWMRIPNADVKGQIRLDQEPSILFCAGLDGSVACVDIRDPAHKVFVHRSRLPVYCTAWAPHLGLALTPSTESSLDYCRVRMEAYGRGSKCSDHLGPIWTAATSDYHAMVATGGADGTLAVVNGELGARSVRKKSILKVSTYEMDYDRHTDTYRMTDDMLPEFLRRETTETRRSTMGKARIKIDFHPSQTTAVTWAPEVGIHRAAWNNANGIGRAGFLLSGTASGLARIDVIKGEYRQDRKVWDLSVVRGETADELIIDDEEEDDEA